MCLFWWRIPRFRVASSQADPSDCFVWTAGPCPRCTHLGALVTYFTPQMKRAASNMKAAQPE